MVKNITKTLLASFVASALTTNMVLAEAVAPTLKISGFSVVNLWGVSQKQRGNGKGAGYHLANNVSDLYFVVAGKTENDFRYKYQLTFEAIPGAGSLHISQNFIELGKGAVIQFGSVYGVERTYVQDASRIIGGAGGFSGALTDVFNFSAGIVHSFRLVGETKNRTKIVVYTPEYGGLSFGVSFTPDTSHQGDGGLDTSHSKGEKNTGNHSLYPESRRSPYGVHSISVGALFKRESGDWSVKLAALGIFDRSYLVDTTGTTYYRQNVQNVKGFQVGGIIGYSKFKVAGGFLDNGHSRLPRNGTTSTGGISLGNMWQGNSGKSWNVGGSYTQGPYQMGLAFQRSDRKTGTGNATSNITSATFGVTPLQGLKFYVEGDAISTRSNAGAVALQSAFNAQFASSLKSSNAKNSGYVTLAGVEVSF